TNTFDSILSIVSFANDYEFNTLLKDNKEDSIFLDEKYYDHNHTRKFNKGVYLFDNMYSKDNITDGFQNLTELRINKIIKQHYSNNELDNFEMREKVYKENYLENTKKNLFKKFFQ